MSFYKIAYDANYLNEQTVCDYELGDFDYFAFSKGKRYKGKIPKYVKLYIREGVENLPQASLLASPLSQWKIFSQSLLDYWWPLMKDDVQVLDAPVYLKSGKKVKGYKLINPLRVIDCLDIEKSQVSWRDGTISFVGKTYIKKDKVGDHHIFRLKGYKHPVIVSEKLAKSLKGTNFKGIAFIRCGVS
jgi:hypothetical protein